MQRKEQSYTTDFREIVRNARNFRLLDLNAKCFYTYIGIYR